MPRDTELLEWLAHNGYANLRQLDDGTIVGTLELIFTRSLCVDLDRWGWGTRYCYEDRPRATEACLAMTSGDDKPLAGYVAKRARDSPAKQP